jgi:molecular chaperone GrpE
LAGVIVVNEKNENSNKKLKIDAEDVQNSQNEEAISMDDAPEQKSQLTQEEEIAQLKEKLDKEHDLYIRAVAELDNVRKRCKRDMDEALIRGRIQILEELLPSLDSIDMALKSIEPNESNRAVYDGMLMVQKQFMSSMEKFSLVAIEAKGKPFNPALHEAVAHIASDEVDSGLIIDEMRKGYTLGDKLIRASMVVVSSGSSNKGTETNDNPDEDQKRSSSDLSENESDAEA